MRPSSFHSNLQCRQFQILRRGPLPIKAILVRFAYTNFPDAISYTLTEARRGYLFRCVVTASDGRAATSNAQGFVLVESVDSDSMPVGTADEEEPIED